MMWKKIFSGLVIGAILGFGSTFFIFQGRLSILEEKVSKLEEKASIEQKSPQDYGEKKPKNPPIGSLSKPALKNGRIEGILTDRSGRPISDINIKTRNGPEALTDMDGRFIIDKVESGDQILIISPPSGSGELTQNIFIEANRSTKTSIIYDSESSRLALLSITSPVDNGELKVLNEGGEYFATVYGRADGLSQIFKPKRFDIWLLVSSVRDSKLWVQHPPAIVNLASNTWQGKVRLGSPGTAPKNGDHWIIVAVAASHESEIGRILNTPRMSLLPTHISSNVVSAISAIKGSKIN